MYIRRGAYASRRIADTVESMNTLLALDGTNLVHRSYHALLSTDMRHEDEAVWAVHGVVNALAKYVDIHEPTSIVAAFDAPGGCPSRKLLAPSYKEGRSETPADLTLQLGRVQDVLCSMGVACISYPEWEADDILATLAERARVAGAKAVIVTSDKDAHQLVTPGISVYKPEGIDVDDAYLIKKYDIPGGHRWVEYAALLGEGADNLSGVLGVGPKRAAAILNGFNDVEDALANPEAVVALVGAKVAGQLAAGAEVFRRNRLVGTLRRDLDLNLSSIRVSGIQGDIVNSAAEAYGVRVAGGRLAAALRRATGTLYAA